MGIPIIAVVVYAIVELLKLAFKNNETFFNFIPLTAGLMGGAMGIIAFYFSPTLIAATDIFQAFLVGLLSGLSATGTNQVIKQIIEYGQNKTNGNIQNNNNEDDTKQ